MTLLYIYMAIGFIIWNIGMLSDPEIKNWSFAKGLGFMFFSTFFWGLILIKFLVFNKK